MRPNHCSESEQFHLPGCHTRPGRPAAGYLTAAYIFPKVSSRLTAKLTGSGECLANSECISANYQLNDASQGCLFNKM
jgi:hypothetical protein